MAEKKGTLRQCRKGHSYYKSSACPVCPQCEKLKYSADDLLNTLSAPARRALENQGINSLKKLSNYSEKKLLLLHGFGKSSIPKIEKALNENGLSLKPNDQH